MLTNKKHDAALLIDGLFYMSKKVNSIVGNNMTTLFGQENISLRRSEIYINKNKGTKCSFELTSSNTSKWALGNYILTNLKTPMVYFNLETRNFI